MFCLLPPFKAAGVVPGDRRAKRQRDHLRGRAWSALQASPRVEAVAHELPDLGHHAELLVELDHAVLGQARDGEVEESPLQLGLCQVRNLCRLRRRHFVLKEGRELRGVAEEDPAAGAAQRH